MNRVRQETIGQNVTYYFLLDNTLDRIFAVPSDIAPMVRMTDVGDIVSLSFQEDGASVVDVLEFENKSLSLRQSELQTLIEAQNSNTQGEP